MAITIDDCDVLIPMQRHMARLCLVACLGVVCVGLAVLGFGIAQGPDALISMGGTVISTVGLVPFKTYYMHEQNRSILEQVRTALSRGAVLSDFTMAQVNSIFGGKAS